MNTGSDSSLGEVERCRCANEAASLDDFEKRPRNTNIHPAISRRSMYYNIHFLVAYYRVHALLTIKDRRGRASTDGTPRDWTDRDIKSLRPFRRSEEHTSELQSLLRISSAILRLNTRIIQDKSLTHM